jgi:predicted alpha/beta-hydrolase family hydrolase
MGKPSEAPPQSWKVTGDKWVASGMFEPSPSPLKSDVLYVMAHGAGSNMDHPSMTRLANEFLKRGVHVARFNFPYREQGKSVPDRMPRLTECFTVVVNHIKERFHPKHLVIGGRSMGGRVASMLAAEGFEIGGLLLLAYPLHAPGRPEELRDAHLPKVSAPVLCFNGTRDAFCRQDLMEKVMQHLGQNWTMHWIEGADHGFRVNKGAGKTYDDVINDIGETSLTWLRESVAQR